MPMQEQEERMIIRGGVLKLRPLPSGNLAIKPNVGDAEIQRKVALVVGRYGGYWDHDFGAWIVIARWISQVKEDLKSLC